MNVKRITTALTTLAVAATVGFAGANTASAADTDATASYAGKTISVNVAKPSAVTQSADGSVHIDIRVRVTASFKINTDPELLASGTDINLGKSTTTSYVQVVPKLTRVSDDGKSVVFTKRVYVSKKTLNRAGGTGTWQVLLRTATAYDKAENFVSGFWSGSRNYGKVVETFSVKPNAGA